jgi:hypothetical protein
MEELEVAARFSIATSIRDSQESGSDEKIRSYPARDDAQFELWILGCSIDLAAELGIADWFNDQPKTIAQLAAATNTQPRSLYRLLRALASVGIFLLG